MSDIHHQTKQVADYLPKIVRNLRLAGLTNSQLMVLLILKDMQGVALPIGKLARELGISFPAISGVVERLYKEELLERIHSLDDRRQVLVRLSKSGEQAAQKMFHKFEKLLSDILKEIPSPERVAIISAVKKVSDFSSAVSKSTRGHNSQLSSALS
jgi:DNA-binding MarR family transcriptional regulator